MNSKAKGNRFENQIAKTLSSWIFGDVDMLSRHPTSGAKKCAYVGDIVPQKQLPSNFQFELLIECKTGYKDKIPTFFNYKIMEDWIIKACFELTEQQHILWLLTQFQSKKEILLTTNNELKNINWEICLNIEYDSIYSQFFIYKFKPILQYAYEDII